jgi:hypothetical protein
MHLKVFVKLKKTLKTLSSGQKTQKKTKKNQKTLKNPPKKNQKNPLGWLKKKKKKRVFSNPVMYRTNVKIVKTAEKTITVRTVRSTFSESLYFHWLTKEVLIALLSRVVDPDTELFD